MCALACSVSVTDKRALTTMTSGTMVALCKAAGMTPKKMHAEVQETRELSIGDGQEDGGDVIRDEEDAKDASTTHSTTMQPWDDSK